MAVSAIRSLSGLLEKCCYFILNMLPNNRLYNVSHIAYKVGDSSAVTKCCLLAEFSAA
jgi:hypothetical protein